MAEVRLPNFDVETIRAFLVVVRCKNFGDASEVLHKTPAAVSYRIRSLEQQLGCPLFRRTHLTLELLQTGKKLEELFTKIYALMESVPAQIHQVHDGFIPELSIAYRPGLTTEAIEKLSTFLSNHYPKTHFKFNLLNVSQELESLEYYHCVIGEENHLSLKQDWSSKLLGKVRWVALAKNDTWEQGDIQRVCTIKNDPIEYLPHSPDGSPFINAQQVCLPEEVLFKYFTQKSHTVAVVTEQMAQAFLAQNRCCDYTLKLLNEGAFFLMYHRTFGEELAKVISQFILTHRVDFGLNTSLNDE